MHMMMVTVVQEEVTAVIQTAATAVRTTIPSRQTEEPQRKDRGIEGKRDQKGINMNGIQKKISQTVCVNSQS